MDFEKYIHEKDVEKEVENLQAELVKFSVSVSDNINRRLKYVAGELDLTRTELVRDLIAMSLYELEKHLELDPLDFEQPYANFIYSDMEEISVGPLKVTKDQFIQMVKDSRKREEEKDGVTNE